MEKTCSIASATLIGVEALPIEVEVAVCNGLPGVHIVGMPDSAVQEARERVRSAIQACGFTMPNRKIVVNLAPGNVKKTGSGFDLPIAIGILGATGQLNMDIARNRMFIGELSLEGFVRPVLGHLAFALCAKKMGYGLVSSPDMLAPLRDMEQLALESLGRLHVEEPFTVLHHEEGVYQAKEGEIDFKDIYGHEVAKRALQIAVAGRHGVLMVGPPGSGKTMLASRVSTIMPHLSQDEMIETAIVHSIAGESIDDILKGARPFRSPHHSITTAGLIGGGTPIRPGEASLAHKGTLFLDELAEFKVSTLQALRQPMECKEILLTRAEQTVKMPSDFMLVAATNPCPCGYLGDKEHECTCSLSQIDRYRAKLSGPLLDRIDIKLDVDRLPSVNVLKSGDGLDSLTLREGVEQAIIFSRWRRSKQNEQTDNRTLNNILNTSCKPSSRQIIDSCFLEDEAKKFTCSIADQNKLSGRALISLLKVSRTIADIDESINVEIEHIAEAMCFRMVEHLGEE